MYFGLICVKRTFHGETEKSRIASRSGWTVFGGGRRDLNPWPLEYEAGVVPTRTRLWIIKTLFIMTCIRAMINEIIVYGSRLGRCHVSVHKKHQLCPHATFCAGPISHNFHTSGIHRHNSKPDETTWLHRTSLSCFLFGRSQVEIWAVTAPSVVFLSLSRQTPGQYFKLDRDRFFSRSFRFIVQWSYYHSTPRVYILSCSIDQK